MIITRKYYLYVIPLIILLMDIIVGLKLRDLEKDLYFGQKVFIWSLVLTLIHLLISLVIIHIKRESIFVIVLVNVVSLITLNTLTFPSALQGVGTILFILLSTVFVGVIMKWKKIYVLVISNIIYFSSKLFITLYLLALYSLPGGV
jgi:hypothetical protein